MSAIANVIRLIEKAQRQICEVALDVTCLLDTDKERRDPIAASRVVVRKSAAKLRRTLHKLYDATVDVRGDEVRAQMHQVADQCSSMCRNLDELLDQTEQLRFKPTRRRARAYEAIAHLLWRIDDARFNAQEASKSLNPTPACRLQVRLSAGEMTACAGARAA